MSFSLFRILLFIIILSPGYCTFLFSQDCLVNNSTFKSGESISYMLSYDWFIIWSDVGEVHITATDTIYNDKPAYKYVARGDTYKSWDWIFKVRDKFETVVDKNNLRPFESSRRIREGKYRQDDKYIYHFEDSIVYAQNKTNDNPQTLDTLPISSCTFDIMSTLLYARNLDYTNLEKGDTIPLTVLLDKEEYPIYFRYQGIENYKLKRVGVFECVKFTVMLIEGEMFHEGEDMSIWVTNDKNRIVIYAESPILVGSIKLKLLEIDNNRHPLTSMKRKL